jgi:prophage maintenance system killer protein
VDGSMRASLAAAIAFLGLSGLWLDADPGDLAEQVLGVARGTSTKSELAEFIRGSVVRFP